MNPSGVITRFGTTLTVQRYAAPTTDGHGRIIPAVPESLSITASVQDVSGRELMRLPEGLRTRDLVTVYTTDDLRGADDAAGTPPDRFTLGTNTYEVQMVEDWTAIGDYVKAIAAKVPAA